jgi:hypothetical protein
MKMEQTECSETLAYKIQPPGNYPEKTDDSKLILERMWFGGMGGQDSREERKWMDPAAGQET